MYITSNAKKKKYFQHNNKKIESLFFLKLPNIHVLCSLLVGYVVLPLEMLRQYFPILTNSAAYLASGRVVLRVPADEVSPSTGLGRVHLVTQHAAPHWRHLGVVKHDVQVGHF